MRRKFPIYIQTESKDCGPTCIKIVAKHYGKTVNTQYLRSLSETTREGSSLFGLSEAVEQIGFRSISLRLPFENLLQAPLPLIVHWNRFHFVVVYKIKKGLVYISDPAIGLITYPIKEFIHRWIGRHANEQTPEGIALVLEPTPYFYQEEFESDTSFGFSFITKYLLKYKHFIAQLVMGLLAGSLLQVILPFLTQSIVDVGIQNYNLHFVYLVLIAQLFLFAGKTTVEVIRGWILLHLSTRINISLVADFFIKLMKLPIAFFDARMTGDLLQRINDHKRIERILTTSSLSILFSMVNLLIFSLVMAYYSLQIFGIFLTGSLLYVLWIVFFLEKRKELDYKRFDEVSKEQSKVIEMINGMQEIKLHNAERRLRWKWEFVQVRLFKIAIKNLTLEQSQAVGSSFINELKNILITVLAAKLVIDGQITLGMMMAITYIVGQMNAPIAQLIDFLRDVQDAKISLDRLGEIHHKKDEEQSNAEKMNSVPELRSIQLRELSFRYPGTTDFVLKNLSLTIPANKTTAIVGFSGSGKTTLLKLLLHFYAPSEGQLLVNEFPLQSISQKTWRDYCGVVMQEGYIFNETIANNIAIGVDQIDRERLNYAIDIANIKAYIDRLPMGVKTKIGNEGVGLSTGQKQRLLIARAVYKNPQFIVLDEATSALDANNEKVIMENLSAFLKRKTVVVIAHRLSTVKNADQIVVLDQGRIVEVGNHQDLLQQKGHYYNLVKNQLELGK